MASILKHLRSSTADKRPTGSGLSDGQLAINTASGTPGVFVKDSAGNVVKIGPAHVGTAAPNAVPAGSAGNSRGEMWVDEATTTPGLKYYNGASFINLTPSGTTTTVGLVELATPAETQAGTDGVRAVTPSGLQSKISDSISTTSSTTIASATAVKTAYDLANAALPKTGGTITGELLISPSGSLVFEGSVDDSFETTIAVVNPTADRTITFPDITGTVITSADTGTVTGTMIANGTITNDDINASAAIVDTKLATISTAGKVSNSATTATSANTASAIVARDGSGNFAAGTITAALTGNASTATALSSARTFALTGNVTGSVSSDLTSGASISATIASGVVTSAMIVDGTIVNADVNASAAIAGTKISPDFGSQNIITTGLFSHALGTAGAPTITFTGDANTGIYSPGADQVAISTNGTGRLFVRSTGKIGVGESDPAEVFEVRDGNIGLDSAGSTVGDRTTERFYKRTDNGSSNGMAAIGMNGTGANGFLGEIKFYTGASDVFNASLSERMRLDSSGRLGIGTSSPSQLLHAQVSSANTVFLGSHNNTGVNLYANDSTGEARLTAKRLGGAGGKFLSFYTDTGSAEFERARIDSSGRLGIGTSAPPALFSAHSTDTSADFFIGEFQSTANPTGLSNTYVKFEKGDGFGGAVGGFIEQGVGSGLKLAALNGGTLTDVVTIRHTGRVGIGTTSVTNLLHLRSDSASAVDHLYLQNRNGGSNSGARIAFSNGTVDYSDNRYAYIGAVNTGAAENGNHLVFATNANGGTASERARIDSSGRLLVGTSTAISSSLLDTAYSQVAGTNNETSQLLIARFSNDTDKPRLTFAKSRGSLGTNTIVQSGDVLGEVIFTGAAGNASNAYPIAAWIRTEVDGTPGTNDMPGRLLFSTTADGASSPTERMRITSAGLFGFNTGSNTPAGTIELRPSTGTGASIAISNSASSDGSPQRLILGSEGPGLNGIAYLDTTKSGVASDTPLAFRINSTERARIDTSGRLLVGTSSLSSGNAILAAQGRSDSSTAGGKILICKGSGDPLDGGALGTLEFSGNNHVPAANINAVRDGGTWTAGTSQPSRLVFSTTADGASSPTERMRITNDGTININATGNPWQATGNNPKVQIEKGRVSAANYQGSAFTANRTDTNGSVFDFYREAVFVGSISVTTTATAYNTSSDYRLKENIVPLTGAANRLNQLQVHRFNFIADPDKTVDGFIAHEAQAVVPECVTGTKDEVDDDGSPVYQGIDQSKLVPLLTAALQEALVKIEVLEQRLTDAGIA